MVLKRQADTLEAEIAGIWAEALGVKNVEQRVDFVALGGHSLQAAQIVEQVARRFGMEDQARKLLGLSTVAEQAAFIRSRL